MEAPIANTDSYARIIVGGSDGEGRPIGHVYAKRTGHYAIYGTIERVQILYADDPLEQAQQRRRMASLACLRSEIDGALAPWRKASEIWRLNAAAALYDGRVASGLIEALEDNPENAARILSAVRAEIAGERASRARLFYLAYTILVALPFLIGGIFALGLIPAGIAASSWPARAVWLSVTTGVLGAVYSIALSIRKREVSDDLRRLDHLTDAAVRVSIGALAGFVVAELLLTGALRLRLGDVTLPTAGGDPLDTTSNVSFVLLAGFLAGFAERFVPDILNGYSGEPPPPPTVVPVATPPGGPDAPPTGDAANRPAPAASKPG